MNGLTRIDFGISDSSEVTILLFFESGEYDSTRTRRVEPQ